MTAASAERLRLDLFDVLHRASDLADLSTRVTRALARHVGFDGACLVSFDPATGLPTSEVSQHALPAHMRMRMAQIEVGDLDVKAFRLLAQAGSPAASLSRATRGDLSRSRRHRELREPNGFGDELRVTLVTDDVAWGGLTLLRGDDRGSFAPDEVDLLATLSSPLAEGVRSAILLTALRARRHEDEGAAGLVLLAEDDSVVMTDTSGEAWLRELERGVGNDQIVPAVARRARATAGGHEPRLARARVCTASGTWVVVRGSVLSGDSTARTAITIEPAGTHELAPLIAEAYGLTERERMITQLVAQGLPTKTIATRLHISQWTVQDHLKAVFEKTGVHTRGELVSRVFLDHFAPHLSERAAVGRDGWFDHL